MTWSSYIYTCIPFLLDLTSIHHPTLLGHHRVLCWVSVLCSEFPLAVYVMYGSVHMSVPIHPILPNHIHTSLLYTCVSIPAVQIGLSVPLFWILHISIVTLKKKKKTTLLRWKSMKMVLAFWNGTDEGYSSYNWSPFLAKKWLFFPTCICTFLQVQNCLPHWIVFPQMHFS